MKVIIVILAAVAFRHARSHKRFGSGRSATRTAHSPSWQAMKHHQVATDGTGCSTSRRPMSDRLVVRQETRPAQPSPQGSADVVQGLVDGDKGLPRIVFADFPARHHSVPGRLYTGTIAATASGVSATSSKSSYRWRCPVREPAARAKASALAMMRLTSSTLSI